MLTQRWLSSIILSQKIRKRGDKMELWRHKKSGGFMDVIRCDEPSYLIWKWHPAGAVSGKNSRENAIRWGSSLRVKEGSVAVLTYSQPDGYIYDYIEGPSDMTLETYNLPILASLIGTLYDGGSPFQAEVYFINLAELIQIKFGVPFFDVFDPRFPDFGVPVAVRGSINFKITDYKEFIRLHRLENFDLETFRRQIKDAVTRTVKSVVLNAPVEHSIPLAQLERKLPEINDLIESGIKPRLYQYFGVSVSGLDISAIELDKGRDGYRQFKSVTQDISAATIQAQTEVNIQDIRDMQRINALHTSETLRAQRDAEEYARRIQIQTEHLATHQINQQTAVGIAGAEALGTASNGCNTNPAAMMAGMAMGSTIGQHISGMINNIVSGLNQPLPNMPPVPSAAEYHVAVNGQPTGPYDLHILARMAADGTFLPDSLVWKSSLQNWIRADDVSELKNLFHPSTPPPIPSAP